MFVDIHVHTKEKSSDASLPLASIVSSATELGLDALVLTDHDYCWDPDELSSMENRFQKKIILWSGTELIFRECHLLLLGTIPGKQPSFSTPQEAVRFIHDRGGVAVIAHPFSRTKRLTSIDILSLNVDGLEVFNGRRKQYEYRDVFTARALGLAELGGSDEHGDSLPLLGSAITYIPRHTPSLNVFLQCIKSRTTRAVRLFKRKLPCHSFPNDSTQPVRLR